MAKFGAKPMPKPATETKRPGRDHQASGGGKKK